MASKPPQVAREFAITTKITLELGWMDGNYLNQLRRSARTAAKTPTKVAAASQTPVQGKWTRETKKNMEEKLQYLLTNSKSKLTKVDLFVSQNCGSEFPSAENDGLGSP